MLKKILQDYFSFTRKERIAVLILSFLVIITFLLPFWVPYRDVESKEELEKIRFQLNQQLPIMEGRQLASQIDSGYDTLRDRLQSDASVTEKTDLFYFDPNSLSHEGWKKLGLKDKTIMTIHNYISKGGRFKNREDIGKIYGLPANEVERLMPYVKIRAFPTRESDEKRSSVMYTDYHRSQRNQSARIVIDLNTADTSVLIGLPGIGSKLASRIIHFREKLGGFYSVDQLSEIYGLPDSTFDLIRPNLSINKPPEPFININTIQVNELKQHPYLKWNLASAIVEYREQHGNFKSLEDLHKIAPVTIEVYQKIIPYLKLE